MNYYVDYENVGANGLDGIVALKQTDNVRIYYSNNPGMDMQTVEKLVHSSANIQFTRLPVSLKKMNQSNALDIVLLTDISRIAGTSAADSIAVISKDKGYDAVISELNPGKSSRRIVRAESIAAAVSPKNTAAGSWTTPVDMDAVKNLFGFGKPLSGLKESRNQIIQIVQTSRSRHEINTRTNQTFDTEKSRVIMAALKPIIKCLPGQ